MVHSQRLFFILLATATASVAAGMYDKPWAIVESADASSVRKEFPAAITRIDGQSTRNSRESDPIEPGKHTVTVRFSTARVTQSPAEEVREVPLDLAPCTRYRIAAQRTEGTQWKPQVYSEPIGECKRKFKQ
ncbi:MAG TPA: hypothetical protein VH301_11490 [Usitatibacter sp.]|jgi:hypothetical protein|nr:hypothetical protein [Usitatibacter sp.]